MKYTRRQLLMVSCLAVLVLGGCSDVSNHPNNTVSPSPSATENEINTLIYTDQQKKEILAAAQKAGVKKVYIPTIGGGPDDSFEGIEVKENTLILKFLRMAIAQSEEEIGPAVEGSDEKEVQLTDEVNGKWIPEDESSVAFLYFKIVDTYLSYSSAKPFIPQEYEASARSMIPLEVNY
ncbi:hypothetical protein H70357_25945 [Paenibacillus sp. FSL H7-0357]|uniref:hypothetical protein n=1 Tax=Paenibacillus sp. FSL H7-0357 TaxID=1536774 RepID=UPI0004F8065C|nr:hypothetical protein [Paenibacillus sp. FSL H7-0357]AIQ19773.1 hypothetical protein H70357_25945 [Paenibacillus sp. FSL H7-0357]